MALSANTAWEVRPTNGVDTNGGGFVAGATGTDWSQQNAAQYALTGVTTAAANAIMLSASAATDMVGNICQITSGTNFTTGFYQIISVVAGVSITVDRNCTTAAGALGVVNIGGALKTIPAAIAPMVSSNKIFVKAESTITTTASIALNTTGVIPSGSIPPNRLIGYTTSRTDGGRVSITLSTNTGLTALNATTGGWFIENVSIDCASLGTSTGISIAGNFSWVRNCKVQNYGTNGILAGGSSVAITDCEVTGGTSTASGGIKLTGMGVILRNYAHDNVAYGIVGSGTLSIICENLITNNTGAFGNGILVATPFLVLNNTIYGNGSSGIGLSTNFGPANAHARNNLLVSNGGYGMFLAAGTAAFAMFDGNAYFNNTSGTRFGADDTSTNPINGVAPYTNVLDVILTADPFVNAAGGDFRLNSNAGGGVAARGSGTPGALPGVTQTGKLDMGVFQHADGPIGIGKIIQNIGTY